MTWLPASLIPLVAAAVAVAAAIIAFYGAYGTLDPCRVVREDLIASSIANGAERANAEAYLDLTFSSLPRDICFNMLWERWWSD